MQEALQQHYGYLFEEALLEQIENCGILKIIRQGQIIMNIGDAITHMPLLLKGSIKILREDNSGDEL